MTDDTTTPEQPPQVLLRLRDVVARTTLSRAYIYRLVQQGLFPRPVSLGRRASRWVAREVDAWISQHARRRDGGDS